MVDPAGPTRAMWIAVLGAGVWAFVLVVGSFVVPVAGTVTVVSTRSMPPAPPGSVPLTDTLFEVGGLAGVAKIAVPLVAALVVAVAVRSGVRQTSLVVAWTATGLLCLLTLLTLVPFGILMIPSSAALIVACVMATRVERATGS